MTPRRVVVVGAGMVGLSCAWSLQDYGVEVEVLDKGRVGRGASWGNAGYVAPSLTVPLPEPSMLRFGLRAVLDPGSPVRLPVRADTELVRFLVRLVRHCTGRRWSRAMDGYRMLNAQIFDAFDAQRRAGVDAPLREAAVVAAFTEAGQAAGLLHELEGVASAGQQVEVGLLTGAQARAAEPNLSGEIALAVRIDGQRYLDPGAYTAALADQVRARNGKITEDVTVTGVDRHAGRVRVRCADGHRDADAVVLACGAWLPELAGDHGVRVPQYGGRGYSFTVPLRRRLQGPLYFPAARAALAPRGVSAARVTSIMEFQRPDAPPDRRALAATLRAVRPLLEGAEWGSVTDPWVGARPLTADGIPLVGPSATDGVYIAGGHGMWGVTLGPLTGRLLAEHIATGTTPAPLAWLDPLRKSR
jgi:D-amino-acid dehydrogenase